MRHVTLAIGAIVILTGCARLNSIQRNVDLTKHSITLDAEQRVVISNKPGSSSTPIICAEPSPDVFKVRASNVAGLLDKGDSKAIELALSQAEAGQDIGLRTQSIQLLRDAMYRACEGAAAGLITGLQFNELQTRFQKLTAVLLATEQLTGAVQPRPAPVVVAGGAAGTGNGLLQIQQELEKAVVAEKEATSEVDKQKEVVKPLEKNLEDARTTNDKSALDAAERALDEPAKKLRQAEATLQQRTENRESLERQRDAARSAGVSASSGAILVASGPQPQQLAPESVKELATSVSAMVKVVFDQDSIAQRCVRGYLDALSDKENARAELVRLQGSASPAVKEVLKRANQGLLDGVRVKALTDALNGVPPNTYGTDEAELAKAVISKASNSQERLNVLDKYCDKAILGAESQSNTG